MNVIAKKCKNCEFIKRVKTLCGVKYVCSKTNKKVNKNYYCGRSKPIIVEGDL